MARRLALAVFIDACGWDVVHPRPWFLPQLEHRQTVRSLFGYSSACVPAILTGRRPDQNDHWSTFYYAPETSPFKPLKLLKRLPGSIVDRGRVRGWISRGLAKAYGFTGYFQIYNLPFDALPLFDYAEKHDIFRPGGINRGTSIFDDVAALGISSHVSNWRLSEQENLDAIQRAARDCRPNFAFVYMAKLDALLHEHTKDDSPRVDAKLRWYADNLREVLTTCRRYYDEIRWAVFSDHGMATVHRVVDLMSGLSNLPLRYGQDFAAVYDSTMLRFWFLTAGARDAIVQALPDTDDGRWLTDDELREYGTYWPDGRFGHAIYALNPGVLINPSHMGLVAPRGMHGYRPEHPDSDAALLSNFEPTGSVREITDLHGVMLDMAQWSVSA